MTWAERREALRFIRLILEQVSALELIRRAKLLKEDSELKRTLLLQALVAIHQSKPLLVSMKESVEMELLRRIGEIIDSPTITSVSRKKTKGKLVEFSDYCRSTREKFYNLSRNCWNVL